MRAWAGVLVCGLLGACGGASSNDENTGGSSGASGSSGAGGSSGSSGGNGGSSGTSGASGGGGGTPGTGGSSGGGAVSGAGGGGGAGGSPSGGSGGNVGGSGGSIPLDCQLLCDKTSAAGCPNDPDEASCISTCQDDISAFTTACPAETDAMMSCFKTTGVVTCNAGGESDIDGCDPQIVTWGACSICVASPADDACEQCQKASCCPELQGFIAAPDALAYGECRDACTTPQCGTACDGQFPSAAQAAQAVASCVVDACAAVCID